MALARSRLNVQDDKIVGGGSARFSFENIRRALFPEGPPKRRTLRELKDGIRRSVRERFAAVSKE